MADDEIDPLDAFMAGVEQQVAAERSSQPTARAARPDIDEMDAVESFLASRKQQPQPAASSSAPSRAAGALAPPPGCDDEDAEVYAAAAAAEDSGDEGERPRKRVEPLAPVDHAQIAYAEFDKDFYVEAEAVTRMGEAEVAALRARHAIHVAGANPVRPVSGFEQLADVGPVWAKIQGVADAEGYLTPTPVQMQALPAALAGRDMIGLAKTGSGKTMAYVAPMMVHVVTQPQLRKGDGPIGVVLAPTRELAAQIHVETRKFARPFNVRCAVVYGGVSKFEQVKMLKAGAEVVVATPGRLIDMIKLKGTNLRRCTFLVLDECDRMFDMGFEEQVRSLVGHVRPDRQTLLFSATMKKTVERLTWDVLTDPLKITIGSVGEANEDVRQVVEVVPTDAEKTPWLLGHVQSFVATGSLLIFVSQRARAEEVSSLLVANGIHAAALHGEKDQTDRQKIVFAFKNENLKVLVATDVAARGLDIKAVKTVVNLDAARDIDSHVHRVGRTGRAGATDGVAYSLVTRKEVSFAGELVRSLERASQPVPPELLDLANQNPRFRQQRDKFQRGSRGGARGGRGGARGGFTQQGVITSIPGAQYGNGRGRGIGFAPPKESAPLGRGSLSGFTRAQDQSGEAGGIAPAPTMQTGKPFMSGFKRAADDNDSGSFRAMPVVVPQVSLPVVPAPAPAAVLPVPQRFSNQDRKDSRRGRDSHRRSRSRSRSSSRSRSRSRHRSHGHGHSRHSSRRHRSPSYSGSSSSRSRSPSRGRHSRSRSRSRSKR